MGEHWELIRFVVITHMIEPVILGLAWLDKWRPTIWWEGGFRRLRLPVGPCPLAEQQHSDPRGEMAAPTTERGYPDVYEDLSVVFSEDECETLPPHQDTRTLIAP